MNTGPSMQGSAPSGPGPTGNPPSDFTQKVQVLTGLLVAGFAGVLNFIGLRSGEVSAVLRNEAHSPTIVLGLLAVGTLTAVASIFVSSAWKAKKWAVRATTFALIVPAALVVWLIPIHTMTSPGVQRIAMVVTVICGVLAIIFCLPPAIRRSRSLLDSSRSPRDAPVTQPQGSGPAPDPSESKVGTQGLLLFVAIALTATAIYAALRLETGSQLASTAAQLSATVSETSGTASLKVSIDASKLASADRVNVSVTGLESGKLHKVCYEVRSLGTLRCFQAPCYVAYYVNDKSPNGCDSLSSGVYQPNADGLVQQTLVVPFSDLRYQRLELLGEVCTVRISGRPCVYYRKNPVTRVDIQIPRYGT